jgi:hypothetical protein
MSSKRGASLSDRNLLLGAGAGKGCEGHVRGGKGVKILGKLGLGRRFPAFWGGLSGEKWLGREDLLLEEE